MQKSCSILLLKKTSKTLLTFIFLYWTKPRQKHFELINATLRERNRAREKDRESFNSFIMHLIECVWLYLAVSVAAQELIDLSAHLCGDELRLNTANCLQMKHAAQFQQQSHIYIIWNGPHSAVFQFEPKPHIYHLMRWF